MIRGGAWTIRSAEPKGDAKAIYRLCRLGLWIVGFGFAVALYGNADTVRDFRFEPQPLTDAIESFAEVTGFDVLAQGELLSGKTTVSVNGTMSASEALSRLLADTQLTYKFVSESTIVITERKPNLAEQSKQRKPNAESRETEYGRLVELAPFTVTASGSQSVLHVTQSDLRKRQATDLDDTLSIDPSITVGGSTGVAQKIYVRNLGEGLLNVSIDGAQQGGSLFHHIGRLWIEPELLKQVEVQPGVGDASDGPGTLGGAIRFETITPDDLLDDGRGTGGSLKLGYFGNTEGKKASVSLASRFNDTWSALVSQVASDYGRIEDGKGMRIEGSDTKKQVWLAKLVGELDQGESVWLSLETLSEEGNKLRRPEWAPGPENPVFPLKIDRATGVAGYAHRSKAVGWIDLEAKASFSESKLLQDAVWGEYAGEVETLQFDMRNRQAVNEHELEYGFDYREDKVKAGPTDGSEIHVEKGSVTGFFIQDSFRASETFVVNLGARVDFYRLRDSQGLEFSREGVSPNLGFVYDISHRLELSGGMAASYRGPGVNDAFRIYESSNAPDLKAEKALNSELGIRFGEGAFDMEAGVFRHRIDDVITNTLPWGTHYDNAGELETDGYFFRTSYATEQMRLSLQYNNADTTIGDRVATRYQYGSLVSTTGNTWVAEAAWTPRNGFSLGWNARAVEGIDDILIPVEVTEIAGTRIDKPGYVAHDVFLAWSPAAFDRMTVTVTVKNVFDKYYISHGSVEDLTGIPEFESVVGAPEAGRDLRLSVALRF